LLELIDAAVADGWDHRRACAYLELGEGRAWRWRERRAAGTLDDRASGGHPVHAITAAEEQAILAVFEAHQDSDRSHRKLAHRGSYEGVVSVSTLAVAPAWTWEFQSASQQVVSIVVALRGHRVRLGLQVLVVDESDSGMT